MPQLEMITIKLYPEQLEALRDRRDAMRLPMAQQVRDAVTEYLRRRGIALLEFSVAQELQVPK